MKKNGILSLLLCSVIIFTSMPLSVSAQNIEIIEEPFISEYVANEIVITTSSEMVDVTDAFVTASVSDCTLIDFEEEEIEIIEEIETYNYDSGEKTYVISYEGDILEKCKELEALPGVECAEPNAVFYTNEFEMPGEITTPSYIYSNYQKWYFDLMQVPQTYETYQTAGADVVVAVIDNGFDVNALEFATYLWEDANGNHGWNTDNNTSDITPIYKKDGTEFNNSLHGTHVASSIGMLSNNSNAVGMAFEAELMLIQAAHYVNETQMPQFDVASLVSAIDYARNNGADIINMSLGAFTTSSSLEAAVNRAYNAGVAIIAAAGNSAVSTASSRSIPAAYPNVIGVMATDKTTVSQLSDFSNYDPSGKYYDIAAPGVQIVGSNLTGGLSIMNGTSQASPLVSSCAAMYLSKYPQATVDELYEAIRNSPTQQVQTNPDVSSTTYYFKFLNAYELLSYGKITPELIFNLETSVTKDSTFNYIYGLNERYTNIYDYVSVAEETGTSEFIPSENGLGTGSVLNVYDNDGKLFATYQIIIFGDLNGDSVADGQDAVITSFIIDSPDSFEHYQYFAADVDFDNLVSENDYYITADYAIGKDFVFQSK